MASKLQAKVAHASARNSALRQVLDSIIERLDASDSGGGGKDDVAEMIQEARDTE